jgi:PAS domain S-box-containing protein
VEDKDKTREQLINELVELRQKIQELETSKEEASLNTSIPELLTRDKITAELQKNLVSASVAFHQPVNKLRKYHISELVDITLLQQLFDSFYELTGIMHAFLDVDTNILSRTGWTDICLNFHRTCPQTECRCRQSDSYIKDHLQDGPYIKYKCLNGLTEYATPIIVEGQHLGSIHMGQLFNEPPDLDYFRRQAQEFGFDEAAYLEAVSNVNIIPEHRIEPIMKFYSKLGQVLATIGLERLHRLEAAETALLLSEKKFFKAFNCNADPMSISTLKENRYVEVNDAFLKISGYQENEVIGKTIHELGVWALSEERNLIIKQVKENGNIHNMETKFRTKSGEIRTVLTSVELIDINGVAHMLATTRDITERKQMEEELRLSEECFSKAFSTSSVLMSISTMKEGRYIKANAAFCSTMGYSEDSLIGQSSLDLGFWIDPIERDAVKQRLMANQSVQDKEIHFCTKTGEERTGLYSAQRIDVHGEPCMLSVIMDITDVKKMEAEMTRLDRLNIVGQMAASIGHEIRNPMTTVRGYLQFLRENENYSQEIEYFDLMIEELDRANSIITEFLSLAKNKIVELKLTNLNEIIRKLWPLVQVKAVSRDQHIRLELNDLPDLLLDIKEIRQLILNLVNNGMESMSSSGVVLIRTFVEKDTAVLAIKDNGQGINRDLLDKLGTPFLTTKEQGTGLGLAVCYRIATRHNAKIDIETSSNGTTFYVRFPIQ